MQRTQQIPLLHTGLAGICEMQLRGLNWSVECLRVELYQVPNNLGVALLVSHPASTL